MKRQNNEAERELKVKQQYYYSSTEKKNEKEISVNAKAKCGKLRGEKIFGKNGSYQ